MVNRTKLSERERQRQRERERKWSKVKDCQAILLCVRMSVCKCLCFSVQLCVCSSLCLCVCVCSHLFVCSKKMSILVCLPSCLSFIFCDSNYFSVFCIQWLFMYLFQYFVWVGGFVCEIVARWLGRMKKTRGRSRLTKHKTVREKHRWNQRDFRRNESERTGT